jgi:hypothetical protein
MRSASTSSWHIEPSNIASVTRAGVKLATHRRVPPLRTSRQTVAPRHEPRTRPQVLPRPRSTLEVTVFGDHKPVSTLIGVEALAQPEYLIEVEAVVD